MTARGWCPDVFKPMQGADGLLVRIKPRHGGMSADTAAAIAFAAEAYGNGTIEITSGMNMQIRGIRPDCVGQFAKAMVALGVAADCPERERRRICVVSPLAGDDPDIAGDPCGVADAIEHEIGETRALEALPAKFRIVVDGGGVLPLDGMAGNARVVLSPGAAVIRVGALVHTSTHSQAAVAIADLIERVQVDSSPKMSNERVSAGTHTPTGMPAFIRYRCGSRGALSVVPPFGTTNATSLRAIANVAKCFGDGVIRIGPGRTILIGAVRTADAHMTRVASAVAGFVTDPHDARLRIAACVGSDGCLEGSVRARQDAAEIAATLSTFPFLHISGCRKGCAHPSPSPVTLVGRDGRYDVVVDGQSRDQPKHAGLEIDAVKAFLAAQFAQQSPS